MGKTTKVILEAAEYLPSANSILGMRTELVTATLDNGEILKLSVSINAAIIIEMSDGRALIIKAQEFFSNAIDYFDFEVDLGVKI